MKKFRPTAAKLLPLGTILFFLLLWEFLVRVSHTPVWILPAPSQVIISFGKIGPVLLSHTLVTLMESLLGFGLSIIIAFILALLLDSFYGLRSALYPLIIFSQTVPLIVLTILFVIWFGFGILPKILVVILVCFFPVLISLMNGLEAVDNDQILLFKSMGAKPGAIIRMVKIPAALPSFFSGLRISATYSIMGAIVAEWMGAAKGLGYFMTLAQKGFKVDQVLAIVVVICLLSFGLVKAVDLLEYLLVPWNRKPARTAIEEASV
ncbi:MAG: ABC transporter permease [Syntrophomonadaceae bacterium]|nr:ABC transporter permease [Syntrophomonadaceae bacterium]